MTTAIKAVTQVFDVYIRATPQQVWDAMTDPAVVARFFHGAQLESKPEAGAKLRSWSPDGSQQWTDNTVLEYDPPRKLVFAWRSLHQPDLAAEAESRVTCEIEERCAGLSKLTLTHDNLDESPKTAHRVRGWSYILSNLKTTIETGEPLPSIM
jgi:uncharacterized protein YndB with AHSA1/START domain